MTTTEFRQFPDPVHGGMRWFPAKGRIETDTHAYPISVEELQFNETFDRSQFRIDPATLPPGVQVNEEGKKSWFTGERRDLFDERRRLVDEETAEMSQILGRDKATASASFATEGVRVQTEETQWWYWALLGGSLLAVLLGIVHIVRTRLSPSDGN